MFHEIYLELRQNYQSDSFMASTVHLLTIIEAIATKTGQAMSSGS